MGNSKRRRIAARAVLAAVASLLVLSALAAPAVGVPEGSHLVFRVQPSDTLAGFAISPPVEVALVDAEGNVVTTFTGAVTVSLRRNLTGATLFGTRTVNAVNGVATFRDLVVDREGGYELEATAEGADKGQSRGFKIRGFATECRTSPCEASTGDFRNPTSDDPFVGKARFDVVPCQESVCPFITVVEEQDQPICGGQACRTGTVLRYFPPSSANGSTGSADLTYDSSVVDVHVSQFRFFLQKDDGSVLEVFDCPSSPPGSEAPPCVAKRAITEAGDARFIVAVRPVDPRLGTG